jgi:hypothetical protein
MVWRNEAQCQLTEISYRSETAQLEESLCAGRQAFRPRAIPRGKNGHREEM